MATYCAHCQQQHLHHRFPERGTVQVVLLVQKVVHQRTAALRGLRARLRRTLGQPPPGYHCRHGHRSANASGSQPAKAVYLRKDRVVAKLVLLHHLLTADEPATVTVYQFRHASLKTRLAEATPENTPALQQRSDLPDPNLKRPGFRPQRRL
ncbi:hypothetical protein ABH935_005676 [Catenulispora sp. GAS73]|uniref:hypothetical protein n=1 Tax=Catenulispora sp. GAS73 TaxID=3156269 RepID=UPI003510E7A6